MMKQPLRVNLHTHTRRCKHAQGEISDYCAEAVRQNVAVLGFSDHSPFPGGGRGVRGDGGKKSLIRQEN